MIPAAKGDASGAPHGATPKGATPTGPAPKGAAPKGAAPKGAAPKGAAPKGAARKDEEATTTAACAMRWRLLVLPLVTIVMDTMPSVMGCDGKGASGFPSKLLVKVAV